MKRSYPIFLLVAALFILKPAPVRADATTLQKTISSNESYVRRFKAEQTQLLRQPPDSESKTKLDNLNKKIRALESENARLKPFVKSEPDPQASSGATPAQPPQLSTQWLDFIPPKEPEVEEDVYYVGADWIRMSMGQKEKYIELANSQLAKMGVLVTKHVFFYQMELDKVLRENPELRSKKLDNLFMAQVYRNEPPNRDRLKSFREEIVTGHA